MNSPLLAVVDCAETQIINSILADFRDTQVLI